MENIINESSNGKLSSGELKSIGGSHRLNPTAADAYLKMVDAAKKDGVSWSITDSYRSYEGQDRIFDWAHFNKTGKKRKKGTSGTPAAKPGTSNHGWGSAVDIGVKYGDNSWNWLVKNASKFGFSNPFKNPRTEPWHWEHLSSAKNVGANINTSSSDTEPQSGDTTSITDTESGTDDTKYSKLFNRLNQIDSERISSLLPKQTSGITESLNNGDTVGVFKVISDVKGHGGRKLGNWQSDNAWDLKAPVGTPVYSYTDGVVSKVHESKPGSNKIFGTQISIKGKNGYPNIFYTHLKGSPLQKGQEVKVGDLIGKITMWNAHPESSHVHIGLDGGHDLKDLIDKNPKVFNSSNSNLNTPDIETIVDKNISTTNSSDSISKKLIDKLRQIDTDFVKKLLPSMNESLDKGSFIYPIESEIKTKSSKKIVFKGLYGLKILSPYRGTLMSDDDDKITIRHLYKSKYFYSEISGIDKVTVSKGKSILQGETVGYSGNNPITFKISDDNGKIMSLSKFYPDKTEKKITSPKSLEDTPSSRVSKAISDLFSGVISSPIKLANKALKLDDNEKEKDDINEEINRIKKLL